MENAKNLAEKILKLKKEKNALILAHYYVPLEVQNIADHVCDSFEMAKRAKSAEEQLIIICGVSFMGESAKTLSPNKKVLLPVPSAGCPMAEMVTPEDVKRLKAEHPNAAVMCYVNSSAATKAVCDVCCTSSSALRIAAALENDEIIFIPDKNLGSYVAEKVPGKKFIFHNGFCPIHNSVTVEDVLKAKNLHPNAKFAVHPECRAEVLKYADFIGSTSEIIDFIKASDADEFIIGTEAGVLDRMTAEITDKKFYPVINSFVCENMKKITLETVLAALEEEKYEVLLSDEEIAAAGQSLDRMVKM